MNWYCERPWRPPTRTSCAGNIHTCMPGMRANFGRSRSITRAVGMLSRSASGLRLTNMRPWLTERAPGRAADR